MSEKESESWYCFVGIGIEGLEILGSHQDKDKFIERLKYAKLRARINSHRAIKLYMWEQEFEAKHADFKDSPEYVEMVLENAAGVGY